MGKKSISVGGPAGGPNYRKSPIDNYRKQLGRNEIHKHAKLSQQKQTDQSIRQMTGVKNWRAIILFIILFLGIVTLVYFLLVLQTGAFLLDPSPSTSET